jgi:hypothetical protein
MATRTRTDDDADLAPRTEPAPAGPRRAPDEWRLLLGIRASQHACARIAHGWTEHEHHEGVPMLLTEAAYREAVAAGKAQTPVPSPNALSPHIGRGR